MLSQLPGVLLVHPASAAEARWIGVPALQVHLLQCDFLIQTCSWQPLHQDPPGSQGCHPPGTVGGRSPAAGGGGPRVLLLRGANAIQALPRSAHPEPACSRGQQGQSTHGRQPSSQGVDTSRARPLHGWTREVRDVQQPGHCEIGGDQECQAGLFSQGHFPEEEPALDHPPPVSTTSRVTTPRPTTAGRSLCPSPIPVHPAATIHRGERLPTSYYPTTCYSTTTSRSPAPSHSHSYCQDAGTATTTSTRPNTISLASPSGAATLPTGSFWSDLRSGVGGWLVRWIAITATL